MITKHNKQDKKIYYLFTVDEGLHVFKIEGEGTGLYTHSPYFGELPFFNTKFTLSSDIKDAGHLQSLFEASSDYRLLKQFDDYYALTGRPNHGLFVLKNKRTNSIELWEHDAKEGVMGFQDFKLRFIRLLDNDDPLLRESQRVD